MSEYRIVKKYSGFFSHWYYILEKKEVTKFLWWRFVNWEKVAGNQLTTCQPVNWEEMNIVERIEENP